MSADFDMGPVEMGVPIPDRNSKQLSALERRALELPEGGSFLVSPTGTSHKRSFYFQVVKLITLARGRGYYLRYRAEGEGYRIWRCAPPTKKDV